MLIAVRALETRQAHAALEEKKNQEARLRAEAEARHKLCQTHTLQYKSAISSRCWSCNAPMTQAHVFEVWGDEATPDDVDLHRKARMDVLNSDLKSSLGPFPLGLDIDALVEKEYRKRGGTFSFRPGHTFIKGLHRKVSDYYHYQNNRKIKEKDAVAEMSLRLRWDDRIPGARAKLESMLRFLWTANRGRKACVSNIPTTLWPAA